MCIKVFLLGGQSNMEGADQAWKLQPPYSEPLPGVLVWNRKTNQWSPLSPANANVKDNFGPEISFGHDMAEAFPGDDIRLIKYAVSGTALYNDWSPALPGEQYTGFMNTARAALADLEAAKREYEIAAMLWLQGESDAVEDMADSYEHNLVGFIAHMRAQFKTPEMPFILARVLGHYGRKTGQATIVREVQVRIASADKNAAWFDTDDCTLINEGHYDAAGLVEIGHRFAREYRRSRRENAPEK